jgi:outer membrane protein OmpA-like peptidoglycan-associated protein
VTNSTFINKQTIDWFGTLRGRLGYTGFDRFLVYGTAGLIYGHENLGTTLSVENFGTFSAYKSAVNVGWIAGAGAEYALTSQLGIKGEALYYDAGKTMVTTNAVGVFTHTTDFQMRGPIFRIGLNYRFGVPTPPPPTATPVAAPAPAMAPAPVARKFIVFFDFDKATLTPDAQKVVDAAAAAYKQGGSPKVQLAGYTDLSGTPSYNLKLSQRRADAVSAALVKDGVPKSQIDSKAFGEGNPRVPTADGVREPQNRRVEITE